MASIRRAVSRVNLARIRAMDRLCFPYDVPYRTQGAEWWIALDDEGNPVGYAGIKWLTREGLWFLCRIGVLPSARGQGLAHRLTKVRIAHARRTAPDTQVITYCTRDNLPSANNLIRNGFRLYQPELEYGGEGDLYWSRHV